MQVIVYIFELSPSEKFTILKSIALLATLAKSFCMTVQTYLVYSKKRMPCSCDGHIFIAVKHRSHGTIASVIDASCQFNYVCGNRTTVLFGSQFTHKVWFSTGWKRLKDFQPSYASTRCVIRLWKLVKLEKFLFCFLIFFVFRVGQPLRFLEPIRFLSKFTPLEPKI